MAVTNQTQRQPPSPDDQLWQPFRLKFGLQESQIDRLTLRESYSWGWSFKSPARSRAELLRNSIRSGCAAVRAGSNVLEFQGVWCNLIRQGGGKDDGPRRELLERWKKAGLRAGEVSPSFDSHRQDHGQGRKVHMAAEPGQLRAVRDLLWLWDVWTTRHRIYKESCTATIIQMFKSDPQRSRKILQNVGMKSLSGMEIIHRSTALKFINSEWVSVLLFAVPHTLDI